MSASCLRVETGGTGQPWGARREKICIRVQRERSVRMRLPAARRPAEATRGSQASRCLEDKLPSNSSYKVRMCIMHAWLFGSPLPLRRRDSAGEAAPGKPGCTRGGRARAVAVSFKGFLPMLKLLQN